MADVHDKETRSYNMSRIRSKDTKPEILVRKFLFGKGFARPYKSFGIGSPVRSRVISFPARHILDLQEMLKASAGERDVNLKVN